MFVLNDGTLQSGGPFWDVELGRRDALTTSKDAATNAIPKPTFDVPQLIANFNAVGLDEKDVVSLAGKNRPANLSPTLNREFHIEEQKTFALTLHVRFGKLTANIFNPPEP